jgi:hypothetical protein
MTAYRTSDWRASARMYQGFQSRIVTGTAIFSQKAVNISV